MMVQKRKGDQSLLDMKLCMWRFTNDKRLEHGEPLQLVLVIAQLAHCGDQADQRKGSA